MSTLATLPERIRQAEQQAARDCGHYEAGPDECSLTGIDVNCCPCGHHP